MKKIKLVYRRGVREQMNNTYIIREADSDDAEKMILYLNQVGGESDNLLHEKMNL